MKNNLKFTNRFLLLLIGLFFTSCLNNVEEEIKDPDIVIIDPCIDITFSKNVKPIIDNNCLQCHSSGGSFPNLTTYNGVSSNAAIVKAATGTRIMPQGSATLTTEEIKAISCWVDAGALNN